MKLCDMRDGTLDRRYTCNDYVHDNCSIIMCLILIQSTVLCFVLFIPTPIQEAHIDQLVVIIVVDNLCSDAHIASVPV